MLNEARVLARRQTQYDAVPADVPSLGEVFAALDAAQLPKEAFIEADRDQRPAEERPTLFDDIGRPLNAPALTPTAAQALMVESAGPLPLTDAHRANLAWHRARHSFDRD